MFSLSYGVTTSFWGNKPESDHQKHTQRKRLLADRYAMTNIMREKLMGAIRERARAFLAKCAAATYSVDIYV